MKRLPLLRRVLIVAVVLAIIGGIGWGGYTVWNTYFKEKTASGPYANKPVQIRDIAPKDFGLTTFLPVNGVGNPIKPVSYGGFQIIAGKKTDSDTTLIAMTNEGTALWQTNFPAPLAACSPTLMGNYLPCVFSGKNGSAVATIDVSRGVAQWIYYSDYQYMNVSAASNNTMVLLGTDMSIVTIDSTGTQLSEVLKQQPAEKGQAADISACKVQKGGSLSAPEFFEVLNSTTALAIHNGVSQVIDLYTNRVMASTMGTLLRGYTSVTAQDTTQQDNNTDANSGADAKGAKDAKGAGKDAKGTNARQTEEDAAAAKEQQERRKDIVIAPTSGCAPAMLISGATGQSVFLPSDVIVPTGANNKIPGYVIRDGQLYTIDWDAPTIGRLVDNPSNFTFDGAPLFVDGKDISIALTQNNVVAFSPKTHEVLWQTSLQGRYATIKGDVVLVMGRDGRLQGLSLKDGSVLWTIPMASAGPITNDNKNTITLYGATGFETFEPQKPGTQKPLIQNGKRRAAKEVIGGQTFSVGDCVRVRKTSGSDAAYKAEYTKIACTMEGAEEITQILRTSEFDRDSSPEKMLKTCTENKDTQSVITINNIFAKPEYSGLCTGPLPTKDNKATDGTNPNDRTVGISEAEKRRHPNRIR